MAAGYYFPATKPVFCYFLRRGRLRQLLVVVVADLDHDLLDS